MAGVALGRGLDMLRVFTGGKGAVVAVRAISAYLEIFMIEADQGPVDSRCMTAVALSVSGDMLRRLAGGCDTVVTARA